MKKKKDLSLYLSEDKQNKKCFCTWALATARSPVHFTQHNTNADICPDVSVIGQLLLFHQQSGIFATQVMHTRASEQQLKVMFVVLFFFFSHRYSRVLRGDLAAERGANSGEGRRRARCVGGNFLPHFTQHMLRVYIVSGVVLHRCLAEPRGSQREVPLPALLTPWHWMKQSDANGCEDRETGRNRAMLPLIRLRTCQDAFLGPSVCSGEYFFQHQDEPISILACFSHICKCGPACYWLTSSMNVIRAGKGY